MNHKQQIADTAKKIIERNGVCEGNNCTVCPCGSNVSGTICKIDNDTDEESDEAVEICQQWLIDNGYDAQHQEVITNELKEIKFQDRTRGGYKYKIYTREGMSNEYPLIGEMLSEGGWDVQCWTKDGHYHNDGDKSCFDLVPIEPAELEGLKTKDNIFCLNKSGEVNSFPIRGANFNSVMIWDNFWITREGVPYCIGNGQKMFYRSKERALASVKENNNVD